MMTNVTRANSVASIIRELSAAQKTPKSTSAYIVFVNRPIGRLLAAIAFKFGGTPNGITAVSGTGTYLAAAALAFFGGDFPAAVFAGLALCFFYALDSADGQLARLQGGGSLRGEWLDHFLDGGKIVLLHSAVLAVLIRDSSVPMPLALIVPIVFMLASSLLYGGGTLVNELKRRVATPSESSSKPLVSGFTAKDWVMSGALLAPEHGVISLLVVLLPFPRIFVPIYVLASLVTVVLCVAISIKWYRDLAAADARAGR